MIYRCIRQLPMSIYRNEDDYMAQDYICIEIGTLWIRQTIAMHGMVRLKSKVDDRYIDMYPEILDYHFEEVEDE